MFCDKKIAETQKFPLFLFVLSFERCKIVFFVKVGVQDVVIQQYRPLHRFIAVFFSDFVD